MIVASLAFDALILGLAGSLLGLLAGDAHLTDRLPLCARIYRCRVRDRRPARHRAQTILIALAGGMLAAFAAAACRHW